MSILLGFFGGWGVGGGCGGGWVLVCGGGVGWNGGMGAKSNYYTSRLKSRLSFLEIVDDYPPMVLGFLSGKVNSNNVSNIAGVLSLP